MRVSELVMLARAISAQHHVKVELVGDGACTVWDSQGVTIQLPLPMDIEYEHELYRGYLDHEVGHVRFTDQSVKAKEGLLHTAWNIFEDVYVEGRMGALYPGCKHNLAWLQEYIFTPEHAAKAVSGSDRSWLYMAYLLYVRRDIGHSLDKIVDAIGHDVSELYAVATRPTHSTKENLKAAEDYIALLPDNIKNEDDSTSLEVQRDCHFSVGALGRDLLGCNNAVSTYGDEICNMLRTVPDVLYSIPPNPKLVAALDRCLPPLVQAARYKPAIIGTKGRLSSRHLYRAAVNDGRVFRVPAKRFDHDVEVMFLVDFSGSMILTIREVLSIAASMVAVLERLPRMIVQVWGFRDEEFFNIKGHKCVESPGVFGDTPTGGAMFKLVSYFGEASRKMIFVLTDGMASNPCTVKDALALYKALDIEVYAIGLGEGANLDVFAEGKSVHVEDIHRELAPALRDMLKGVLCK